MANNVCMTLEAWEELTPKISKGIRNLPLIKYAPDNLWVLNIFYGFRTHDYSLKAMETYAEYKVLVIK